MSTKDISLKAACADGFHHPAEWDPSRGSLDAFQRRRGFEHHFGKHRTKNLHKGILLIRFELPFTVQCLRCESYIRQGTRYDADKKKVGMYFTTPIYEFTMHCKVVTGHEKSADGRIYCNQRFVVRTDPKARDYELVEGIRRKVQVWDLEAPEDSGGVTVHDPETRRQMEADPLFRTEKTVRDKAKERSDKDRLSDLLDLQDEREDTYTLNSVLRRSHRVLRAEEAAEKAAGPKNFALALLPPAAEDNEEAGQTHFLTDHDKVNVASMRAALKAAPLISSSSSSASSSSLQQIDVAQSRALVKRKADHLKDVVGGAGKRNVSMDLIAKRSRLAQHACMARRFGSGSSSCTATKVGT